jgi:hypothetical protein
MTDTTPYQDELVNPAVSPGEGPTPITTGPPSPRAGEVPAGYSTYTGAPYDANPVKLPDPGE